MIFVCSSLKIREEREREGERKGHDAGGHMPDAAGGQTPVTFFDVDKMT